MKTNRILLALLGGALALGLAHCGEADDPDDTAKDAALPPPGQDAAQPGPDASQPGPDASQPGPDASQPGPDAGAPTCATIHQLRTDASCQGKTVTISGAVVMGSRLTSLNTKVSMYVQDPAGGPYSGLQIFHLAATYTPVVKDIVTVTGKMITYNQELEIDAQMGGVITKTGIAASLPAPVDAPASGLLPDSAQHDDLLGQRVRVAGALQVIDNRPVEMANWDKVDGGGYTVKYNGVKIEGGILMNNVFTYQSGACPIETLTGVEDLTGVWEWYRQNNDPAVDAGTLKRFLRVVKPLNCAAHQGGP